MAAGFTSPVSGRERRRRSSSSLPPSLAVLDGVMLFLLALLPVAGIWVFGGNRLWIMGPLILVTVLAAVLGVFRFLVSRYRRDIAVPPGGWLLLAFFAYLVALIPFAEVRYDAALETMRFLSYALAYWLWLNLLREQRRWKALVALLLLSVSLMAWYALIQEARGTNLVLNQIRPEQYGMRASGAYICPNHFAHLLQMMVLMGSGLVLCRRAGLPLRLIAGYTVILCLPALYLTESRSGMLGLLAGGVTMAVAIALRNGVRKFLLVLVCAPLVAAAIGVAAWKASPMLQQRVALAMQGDIRLVIWKDSLPIALENPVFGAGLGSYRWMYPHYRTHLTINADPEFAHNDYLHYWAEFGAVGLFLIGLVVLLVVVRAVRLIREDDGDGDVYLMAGLLGMVAGSLVHAFFDFNFHIFANTQVYVFVVAALFAAASNRNACTMRNVARPAARWVGLGIVCLLALAAVGYARAMVSYAYVQLAEPKVIAFRWDQAQPLYPKAIAWAPGNWKAHIGYAHFLQRRSFYALNTQVRTNWLSLARQHYEISLDLNPWEADAIHGLSGLYKREGNQEKALELRRKAVELVPRHVYYLNQLGLQLKDMGRLEEALAVYRQSRDVEPNPDADRNIRLLEAQLAQPP